jgi:hypothetical protein
MVKKRYGLVNSFWNSLAEQGAKYQMHELLVSDIAFCMQLALTYNTYWNHGPGVTERVGRN